MDHSLNCAEVGAQTRNRVDTVDFARGLAAVGVMLYHLFHYEHIGTASRVGFYFVYAFFVISGFSLYISYASRMRSVADIRNYAVKRFGRIAPLFYFTCVFQMILTGVPRLDILALNLSLLFGFANPGATSMVTGGWSIGIEIVFYVAFPLIVICASRSLASLTCIAVIGIILTIGFVNGTVSGHQKMDNALWTPYTQPIAFFGYFVVGCLVGEIYLRHARTLKGHWFWIAIFFLWSVPFFTISAEYAPELLTGWKGLLFMSSTLAAVTAIAFMSEPKGVLHLAAQWLGRLSYPIYLLHPLVYWLVKRLPVGPAEKIILTTVATFALSAIVYEKVEKRFLKKRVDRSDETVLQS